MSIKKLAHHDHSFKKNISKEEISQLPLSRYSGPVHLISSQDQISDIIDELKQESILGFDTETKPSFRKGITHLPALLQLATSQSAYLFQIQQVGLSRELIGIFTDSAVVKVGVALDYDIKKLQEISYFEPRGFVDLRTVATELGIKRTGLRNLAANLLGLRISKSARLSNWAKKQLSPSQINYAATDAWISRELYIYIWNTLGIRPSPFC